MKRLERWGRRVWGWDGVTVRWFVGLYLICLGVAGAGLAVAHDDESRSWLALLLLVAGIGLVLTAGSELHARDIRARRRTAALWSELQAAQAVAVVRRELEERRADEIRAALPAKRVEAFSRSGGGGKAPTPPASHARRPAGALSMDEGELAYGSWGAE